MWGAPKMRNHKSVTSNEYRRFKNYDNPSNITSKTGFLHFSCLHEHGFQSSVPVVIIIRTDDLCAFDDHMYLATCLVWRTEQ